MKIYIIGTVGSGKTTIAKKLSEKYKIKYYELDKVVWDDFNCNIKRSDDDINKIFNKIIKQKNWIIEDVGRDIFRKGIKSADIVYYISLSKSYNYLRIISRWVKQKIGLESYNYKPTSIKEIINDPECNYLIMAPCEGKLISVNGYDGKYINVGDVVAIVEDTEGNQIQVTSKKEGWIKWAWRTSEYLDDLDNMDYPEYVDEDICLYGIKQNK